MEHSINRLKELRNNIPSENYTEDKAHKLSSIVITYISILKHLRETNENIRTKTIYWLDEVDTGVNSILYSKTIKDKKSSYREVRSHTLTDIDELLRIIDTLQA